MILGDQIIVRKKLNLLGEKSDFVESNIGSKIQIKG